MDTFKAGHWSLTINGVPFDSFCEVTRFEAFDCMQQLFQVLVEVDSQRVDLDMEQIRDKPASFRVSTDSQEAVWNGICTSANDVSFDERREGYLQAKYTFLITHPLQTWKNRRKLGGIGALSKSVWDIARELLEPEGFEPRYSVVEKDNPLFQPLGQQRFEHPNDLASFLYMLQTNFITCWCEQTAAKTTRLVLCDRPEKDAKEVTTLKYSPHYADGTTEESPQAGYATRVVPGNQTYPSELEVQTPVPFQRGLLKANYRSESARPGEKRRAVVFAPGIADRVNPRDPAGPDPMPVTDGVAYVRPSQDVLNWTARKLLQQMRSGSGKPAPRAHDTESVQVPTLGKPAQVHRPTGPFAHEQRVAKRAGPSSLSRPKERAAAVNGSGPPHGNNQQEQERFQLEAAGVARPARYVTMETDQFEKTGPGRRVKLGPSLSAPNGHPNQKLAGAELLVICRAIEADLRGPIKVTLECTFAEDPYVAPVTIAKVSRTGLEPARVIGAPDKKTGIRHTAEMGQVQVEGSTNPNPAYESSPWVRTTQPLASQSFTQQWPIPETGSTGAIAHLGGDGKYPVLLGTAYDPENLPPNPKRLPETETQAGLSTRSSPPSADDDRSNWLWWETKAGEELFYTYTPGERIEQTREHCVERCLRERSDIVGGDHPLHVRNELVKCAGQSLRVEMVQADREGLGGETEGECVFSPTGTGLCIEAGKVYLYTPKSTVVLSEEDMYFQTEGTFQMLSETGNVKLEKLTGGEPDPAPKPEPPAQVTSLTRSPRFT